MPGQAAVMLLIVVAACFANMAGDDMLYGTD